MVEGLILLVNKALQGSELLEQLELSKIELAASIAQGALEREHDLAILSER